jgi:hypothetical protein
LPYLRLWMDALSATMAATQVRQREQAADDRDRSQF